MDLGIFRRSRAVFGAWILVPLLAITAVDIGTAGFCFSVKRKLVESRAALRTIDKLTASRARAEQALEEAAKSETGIPTAEEEVSGWIDRIAPLSDFKIETLSVNRSQDSLNKVPSAVSRRRRRTGESAVEKKGLAFIRVTLKGKGSYRSIASFIRDLEAECAMIHVSELSIQREGSTLESPCVCELTFNIYLLEA